MIPQSVSLVTYIIKTSLITLGQCHGNSEPIEESEDEVIEPTEQSIEVAVVI